MPSGMRYSSDIDLVVTRPLEKADLAQKLDRVLEKALGHRAPSLAAEAALAFRNWHRTSEIERLNYGYIPLNLHRPQIIKVEINLQERAPVLPLVEVPITVLDEAGNMTSVAAKTYHLSEILGTKLRALMQRHQGRDLFDLWHAWQVGMSNEEGTMPVDGAQVVATYEAYMDDEGGALRYDDAVENLERNLKKKSFLTDMNTLLRPDASRFNARDAASVVTLNYLRHLKA